MSAVNGEVTWNDLVLHEAAKTGNLDSIKLHIDRGADVNKLINRMTALHLAIINDKLDAAALLIKHGADVNQSYYEVSSTSLSIPPPRNYTPLELAIYGVKDVNLDMIELILKSGAKVDTHNGLMGATPLDAAKLLKNTELVDLIKKYWHIADDNDGDNTNTPPPIIKKTSTMV